MKITATLTALAGLLASSSLAMANPLAAPANAGSGGIASNRCGSRENLKIVGRGLPAKADCDILAAKFVAGDYFDGKASIIIGGTYKQTIRTCTFQITVEGAGMALGKYDVSNLIDSTYSDLQLVNGRYQTGTVPCDYPGTAQGSRGVQSNWQIGHF